MVKDLNDPTNVDTIPAMLTDGEFVLNKEATQMYGPIIAQMNQNGLQQRQAENQMVKANAGMLVQGGYNTGGLVSSSKRRKDTVTKPTKTKQVSGQSVMAGLEILMGRPLNKDKRLKRKQRTSGSINVPPLNVPPLTSTPRSTATTGRKGRRMPLPPFVTT